MTPSSGRLAGPSAGGHALDDRPALLILNLYMVDPPNSGAKVVIRNRIVELSKSFRVTFCCLGESPEDESGAQALRAYGEVVVARPPARARTRWSRVKGLFADPCALGFADALESWLASPEIAGLARRHFDLVEIHSACWHHRRLDDLPGRKILVAQNDEREYYAERVRASWNTGGARTALVAALDAVLVAVQERRAIRRADAVVSLAPASPAGFRARYGDVPVLANWGGVDVDAYDLGDVAPAPELSATHRPILLFVGALFVESVHEAASRFVEEALPEIVAEHPGAAFVLVGDPRGNRVIRELAAHPNVVVTGLVDDVRPYLAAADVVVIPIVHGSGVRFKIMEALAAGKAVVSTEKGAEGLGLVDRETARLVPDVAAMAPAVLDLLRDDALRRRLEHAGRLEARRRFDRITEHRRLGDWYRGLLEARA